MTSFVSTKDQYRLGIGIALLNDQGFLFVGKRHAYPNAWQMPQGGIDAFETPIDALWRELQEETGITQATLVQESKEWISYDLPSSVLPHFFKGRYKGQCQKWFLLHFHGKNSDININAHHEHEFSEWMWMPPLQVFKEIVDFKKNLYKKILGEFFPNIHF